MEDAYPPPLILNAYMSTTSLIQQINCITLELKKQIWRLENMRKEKKNNNLDFISAWNIVQEAYFTCKSIILNIITCLNSAQQNSVSILCLWHHWLKQLWHKTLLDPFLKCLKDEQRLLNWNFPPHFWKQLSRRRWVDFFMGQYMSRLHLGCDHRPA